MTIILGDSPDAVRAITGHDIDKVVVPDDRRRYLPRFDEKAAHYEIAAVQKRGST